MTPTRRIPVLMYHRIGERHNAWEARYGITAESFASHMRRLAGKGASTCTLEQFFQWLRGDIELPEGTFLLTFDDGFAGVHEHALPLLRSLGWSATVFLVSRLIGRTDEWCRAENPSGVTYPLMTPDQLNDLKEAGFSLQSHTRVHPDLTTLSEAELTEELAGSREELQQLLQQPVDYLAYPYGRYNDAVAAAAREAGYSAAFSTQPGFNRRDVDPFRIRRLDVFGTDSAAVLERKIRFGSNDGSWRHVARYYGSRITARLGL